MRGIHRIWCDTLDFISDYVLRSRKSYDLNVCRLKNTDYSSHKTIQIGRRIGFIFKFGKTIAKAVTFPTFGKSTTVYFINI